jgi:hypothetical protein
MLSFDDGKEREEVNAIDNHFKLTWWKCSALPRVCGVTIASDVSQRSYRLGPTRRDEMRLCHRPDAFPGKWSASLTLIATGLLSLAEWEAEQRQARTRGIERLCGCNVSRTQRALPCFRQLRVFMKPKAPSTPAISPETSQRTR